MGPSGSGKTTFVTTLTGEALSYGNRSGTITVNDVHGGDLSSFADRVGFVPQDDVLHGDLTVRENLKYAARYRLPAETTKAERKRIVNNVMKLLEIDHIANSIVGTAEKRGISGGQRKRVSIGVELVAQPSILILDEPTSGLDSTTSEFARCCQLIHGINV